MLYTKTKHRFGKRLAKARKKAGFTQKALAKKIGLSHAAPHHWESGKVTPKARNLRKAARVLGVTVQYLQGVR